VIIEYAGGDAAVGPQNCGPFDPSINQRARHTAAFTSPGKFCPQSKNLIPLGCVVGGVDQSGCLP
jgi:hypothetical protein